MCPHIEATFQLNMNVSKAYSALFSAIQELVGSSLKVEKEIPNVPERKPTFVILKYKYSRQLLAWASVTVNFKDKGERTIIDLKWSYPDYKHDIETNNGLTRIMLQRKASKAYEKAVTSVEELKSRIGATEITEDEASVKEIIKETIIKEVVMIPCKYCGGLMPQTSVFCPNCGARRTA